MEPGQRHRVPRSGGTPVRHRRRIRGAWGGGACLCDTRLGFRKTSLIGESELSLDIVEGPLEDRLAVSVHRLLECGPRPMWVQMAEEAAFRVGLNPEDISLAVREGGEPIRRSARVPRVGS